MTEIQSSGNLNQERSTETIQNIRVRKEFEYLKSIGRVFVEVSKNEVYFERMLDDGQNIYIFLPKQYPFQEPLYALSNDIEDKKPVSEVIEQWVPKIKIFELIELIAQRINERASITKEVDQYVLLKSFHSSKAVNLILIIAIAIRIIVALGPYSGENDSPNYGDFEAHRNWMSVTLNRNTTSWYEENDDQPWWRIDYPPIAAYISYLFGKTYKTIESESMLIQRGYQSDSLKVYMRFTSLLVDIICLFPPVYLLSTLLQKNVPQLLLLIVLLKPDAILIDHGHFQYNSLILGLILLGFYCILTQKWYWACIFYLVAVHSKQMAVYYSLAFLSALIGVTFNHYRFNKPKFYAEIMKYALIVIIGSIIIWAPWFSSTESLKSVVTAIFPIHRGLYQLKVSNFWCISDVIMHWQAHFSKSTLVILCFASSAILSIPSMFSLILNPTKKSLIIGFATISMTFYMFSYHVHEKSILLPLLMMPFAGEIIGGWLTHELIIAGCSAMFHLLRQDNQEFGYFGIMILYTLFSSSYVLLKKKMEKPADQLTLEWHNKIYEKGIFRILFLIAVIYLHAVSLVATPPTGLPYLWHLLLAGFSFAFNLYFLIIANLLQLEWIYTKITNRQLKTH